MIYKIKNNSGAEGTWAGQVVADGEWHTIDEANLPVWRADVTVMQDVAAGNLIVGNESQDWTGDPVGGWNYLMGDNMPKSELDGLKIAVHSSPKPYVPGSRTYAIWTGAGDDIGGGVIGDGPTLHLDMQVGQATTSVDVKFLADQGRVWLHEGYLKFTGAGDGDFMNASVVAEPTALQQSVQLDLEVTDNWIKFAAGGPGTGTHGFADPTAITLVPRTFSKDGDWNFDGTNLTPASGDGLYKISDIERTVHRYINKIPCYGDCSTYFTMSSNESTELPKGYFLRITGHNVSNSDWHASIIMEIYRERTFQP